MSERIYPYKTIAGDIRLDLADLEVDNADPSPNPFDKDNHEVQLFDQEKTGWESLSMKLEVQGPVEELRKLPDNHSLVATAVFTCDETHARHGIVMNRVAPEAARWTTTVTLERKHYRGSVNLEAVLSGTAGGLPNRFLAASLPWTLHFDEPPISHKTGAISVKWVDFKDPEDAAFLKEYANEPFYADLTSEKPVVYLNKSKDFERLPLILDDRRRRGQDLALHNAERTGIARSVWMGLLNTAIAGIVPGQDGEDPDWPEVKWQRLVLKILLRRIYKNQTDGEALKTAYEAWENRHGAGLLESRAQSEINRRIQAAKFLRRTLNLLTMSEETNP